MPKWPVCVWFRLVYIPVWKGSCRRSFELHGLPHCHKISHCSANNDSYRPPKGLCDLPVLDAGFSRSGVPGLACLGFFNIVAARSNNHAVRQTIPTLYNNIFGLLAALRATSEVLSCSHVDLAHTWKSSNFVSPIFTMLQSYFKLEGG